MASDPHARTDKLFKKLMAKAKSDDTKALLEGLQHLCIVTEELSVGQQQLLEQHSDSVAVQNDLLTQISGRIGDLK